MGDSYKSWSAFIVFFMSFIGFYTILAVTLFMGFEETRYFTIPVRLLVTSFMIFNLYNLGLKIPQNYNIYWFFLLFFILYFLSIYQKLAFGTARLYLPHYEYVLYSIVYAIIPFIYFSQRKEIYIYNIYYSAVIISGVFFSLSIIYLYSDILLSGYTRISLARYDVLYQIITPLALSYAGALILGLAITKLLFENVKGRKRFWLVFVCILALIPFFLGASRGSVVALVLPFIVIFFTRLSTKVKKSTLLIGILFPLIVIYLANYFGTGVFSRLLSLYEDIQVGSSSVRRLEMWSSGLNQFISSPLFGDSIGMVMDGSNYPHNIFIEVLMTTGLIGFLPFSLMVIYSIHKSFLILKYRPELIWVVIFYWQALIRVSFSGALYTAIFFWSGLGLIISIDIGSNSNDLKTT